jgi:uncharacterized membrane-anchored protein
MPGTAARVSSLLLLLPVLVVVLLLWLVRSVSWQAPKQTHRPRQLQEASSVAQVP